MAFLQKIKSLFQPNKEDEQIEKIVEVKYFTGHLPNTILVKIINMVMNDYLPQEIGNVKKVDLFLQKFMLLNKNIKNNVMTRLISNSVFNIFNRDTLETYLRFINYIEFKSLYIRSDLKASNPLVSNLNEKLLTNPKDIQFHFLRVDSKLFKWFKVFLSGSLIQSLNSFTIVCQEPDQLTTDDSNNFKEIESNKFNLETLELYIDTFIFYENLFTIVNPEHLKNLKIIDSQDVSIGTGIPTIVDDFPHKYMYKFTNLITLEISSTFYFLNSELCEVFKLNPFLEKFTFTLAYFGSMVECDPTVFFNAIQDHPKLRELSLTFMNVGMRSIPIDQLVNYLSTNTVLETLVYFANIPPPTIPKSKIRNQTLKSLVINPVHYKFLLTCWEIENPQLTSLSLHHNDTLFNINNSTWPTKFPNLQNLTIHQIKKDLNKWVNENLNLVLIHCKKLQVLHTSSEKYEPKCTYDKRIFQLICSSNLVELSIEGDNVDKFNHTIFETNIPTLKKVVLYGITWNDSTMNAIVNNKTVEHLTFFLLNSDRPCPFKFLIHLLQKNKTLKHLNMNSILFEYANLSQFPEFIQVIRDNQTLLSLDLFSIMFPPQYVVEYEKVCNEKLL
ncbi:hypothetical protein DLAC_09182 [Tieghemostelium lacteum]|uniref:Uncharacterized protein n=1 Tax=Tieghemostelium lacteum TaxID=361077 RepID=A0A151Z9D6_TIELA|nr:hypothetical protein DLAC_09182 [Tieghemostelium lacteum]|eukprot:KYQ90556.1 hypothetical protein DLAC_09182 [Tieghemostelium lacteum]